MLSNRIFWYGAIAGVLGTYIYHKHAPGKGLGQPGQMGK